MSINLMPSPDDFYNNLGSFKSHETNDDDGSNECSFLYPPDWVNTTNAGQMRTVCRICPACSKTVDQSDQLLVCLGRHGNHYLAHASCSDNIVQVFECSRSARKISGIKFQASSHSAIGCNEYFATLSVEHPLTSSKFYSKNMRVMESDKTIYFNAEDLKLESLEPNHIILPLKQFKIILNIKPLCKTQFSFSCKFRVDLNQEQQGICHMEVEDYQFIFQAQFQIIDDLETKTQIVDSMNFKYQRPYQKQNFVKFNKFYFEFKSSHSEHIPQPQSPTEVNPEINGSFEKDFRDSPMKSQKEEKFQKEVSLGNSPTLYYEEPEETHSAIDMQFINCIKTQAGSKEFQKKAKTYSKADIDKMITQILPHIEDITLHPYANYMLQSLLSVCNHDQRMRIIQNVGQMFCNLVCQQQGTFVFQQLVALLEYPNQFEAICLSILSQFKTISLDNYGHHFMRRLFEKMPKQLILMFMPAVHLYFIQLSTSKNAVFIAQCVLKGLKELESKTLQYSYHLKKLLQNLTLNCDILISHEFGNYLIQEAYESIQLQRLEGITSYIINFFPDVSCGKFSSNVVLNCLKKYWSSNIRAILLNLKQGMDRKRIRLMYQNKEGNKVLLQIMELHDQFGLKVKISEVIRSEEPSKFNNRRWVNLTGKSKTGAVGTNYTSFSEAHNFNKRKYQH